MIIQRDTLFIATDGICKENQYTNYKDNKKCYTNWLIIFPQKHFLLRKVIDLVMDNLENIQLINEMNSKKVIDNRNKIWVLTGPIVYSRAIYKYINNYKRSTKHGIHACRFYKRISS